MSKRKQSFDNLLEDYSGATEKALYGPEKAERKRTRKTRRRSEARDDQDDREELHPGLTFYSVEELERFQDASESQDSSRLMQMSHGKSPPVMRWVRFKLVV